MSVHNNNSLTDKRKMYGTYKLTISGCLRTYHVWLPQRFTHSIHLFVTCTANNEVVSFHRATYEIHRCAVRFKSLGIKASDHGLNKIRSESGK